MQPVHAQLFSKRNNRHAPTTQNLNDAKWLLTNFHCKLIIMVDQSELAWYSLACYLHSSRLGFLSTSCLSVFRSGFFFFSDGCSWTWICTILFNETHNFSTNTKLLHVEQSLRKMFSLSTECKVILWLERRKGMNPTLSARNHMLLKRQNLSVEAVLLVCRCAVWLVKHPPALSTKPSCEKWSI